MQKDRREDLRGRRLSLEGQLRGQLRYMDFGYHSAINGFRGFLSPAHHLGQSDEVRRDPRTSAKPAQNAGFFIFSRSWERRSLPLTSGGNWEKSWGRLAEPVRELPPDASH